MCACFRRRWHTDKGCFQTGGTKYGAHRSQSWNTRISLRTGGVKCFTAVDELMEEHYTVEKRMMLCGYGIKQSEKTERKVALNDIVIHRTGRCQW